MNKKILILLSFLVMTVISCDKEKFAELNTNPSAISTPNVPFLFSSMVATMNNGAYDEWFYDNDKFFLVWTQINAGNQTTFVRSGESFNVLGRDAGTNPRYSGYMNVLVYAREIWDIIDNRMSENEKAAHQCIRAAVYPLLISKALKMTDAQGSMPYTEAGLAKYTNPMNLTPKYDTQEDLFILWDNELKAAFEVLNNPPANQLLLGKNDWVYGGTGSSWEQWAKLTNTLRLRIAARWYLQDPAKAKAIVEEVWNSGVYMSEIEDDYVHFTGRTGDGLDGNSTARWWGYGNKEFIDFLKENRDPRLRWFFEKNSWSSSVIKAFLATGRPIPEVMQPYIEVSEDGTDFEWINGGEPWGRYHGLPCIIGDLLTQEERDYYLSSNQYQIPEIMESNVTFMPWSEASTAFITPRQSSGFNTYPDIVINADGRGQLPPAITTQSDYHYRGRFVMAAESWYIFAEFKVLGANISEDANVLFHKAIERSVRSHNETASDHNTGYYRTTNLDTYSVVTSLGMGGTAADATAEITALLTKPAYNLTGDQLEDLEKIYINMLTHYNQTPTEIFVTSRRSGVPKLNSTVGFAYTPFSTFETFKVPRRLNINEPSGENINAHNIRQAAADQGFEFNISENQEKLNAQRVWYDKPAPDWGEGPIVK